MCQTCQLFLHDFLEAGIPKDLALSKQTRIQSLRKILPELTEWIYRFYTRLPKEELDKALLTAARIARRGRPILEYEYLIHTATFNFLKYNVNWVKEEAEYMQLRLIESGYISTREKRGDLHQAYAYVSYMTPRAIICLQDLHEDHIHPKGLMTDLNFTRKPRQIQEDEMTCFDKDDDYQKEILEEVSLDNLYT